ncbi:MAG: VanZ family protein [Gemmiger formicilis]|uniref:VanZ family protein n=1 Tax=Gemmiger formicilis TaxID=745368 RepID=UPI0039960A1F
MAVTVQLWLHRVTLRQKALLASALCMLYAAGDEFHQYFVPGRAAQLSDVAVDAMGFRPCGGGVSGALGCQEAAQLTGLNPKIIWVIEVF